MVKDKAERRKLIASTFATIVTEIEVEMARLGRISILDLPQIDRSRIRNF